MPTSTIHRNKKIFKHAFVKIRTYLKCILAILLRLQGYVNFVSAPDYKLIRGRKFRASVTIFHSCTLFRFVGCLEWIKARGTTSSSFRVGAIFMKFHSMTSSCLFNSGTNFSQTVTDEVLFATFPKMRTFSFQSRCRPNDQDRKKLVA